LSLREKRVATGGESPKSETLVSTLEQKKHVVIVTRRRGSGKRVLKAREIRYITEKGSEGRSVQNPATCPTGNGDYTRLREGGKKRVVRFLWGSLGVVDLSQIAPEGFTKGPSKIWREKGTKRRMV